MSKSSDNPRDWATFSPQEITQATGAGVVVSGAESQAHGLSIDTRTLHPGSLFVAIRGERFDGHDFVKEAIQKGAVGLVVERWPLPLNELGNVTVWRVKDTRSALLALAQFHRQRFHPQLIAITGSSGKTTTKNILVHLLSAEEALLATPGTQNNLIGVPLTLFHLTRQHRTVVLELGTNQWGEIRQLTRLTDPTIGVITNIGPAHLKSFGDLQGVLRAKGEMWEEMLPQATLVLNAEDPLLRKAAAGLKQKIVWFGDHPDSLVPLTLIDSEPWGTRFGIAGRGSYWFAIPGRHNWLNAWAALTCIQLLGKDLVSVARRLNTLPSLSGRLFRREIQGVTILDDTYNANPASLEAALQVLKGLPVSGRRVVVIGDMLELGEKSKWLHTEAGAKAAALGVDFLIGVGQWAQDLLRGAQENGLPAAQARSFAQVADAGSFLVEMIRPGDAVLIKGSRAVQMEKILSCFTTSSIH